ncbi:MAG: murein L,D-transpeptidase [Clostridiales bacterium]|nr:murein L,D-transpeptidase [Clostridiales bacterium]
MYILIEKKKRLLTLLDEREQPLFSCPIALGFSPEGPKKKEGDGKTPEGNYFICLKKMGKFGPSLGISYPNEQDAILSHADEQLLSCIRERLAKMERPPWGSFLGGEIYIHGGGAQKDWTAGCIALHEKDAEALYARVPLGTIVRIIP